MKNKIHTTQAVLDYVNNTTTNYNNRLHLHEKVLKLGYVIKQTSHGLFKMPIVDASFVHNRLIVTLDTKQVIMFNSKHICKESNTLTYYATINQVPTVQPVVISKKVIKLFNKTEKYWNKLIQHTDDIIFEGYFDKLKFTASLKESNDAYIKQYNELKSEYNTLFNTYKNNNMNEFKTKFAKLLDLVETNTLYEHIILKCYLNKFTIKAQYYVSYEPTTQTELCTLDELMECNDENGDNDYMNLVDRLSFN